MPRFRVNASLEGDTLPRAPRRDYPESALGHQFYFFSKATARRPVRRLRKIAPIGLEPPAPEASAPVVTPEVIPVAIPRLWGAPLPLSGILFA